MKGLGHGIVVVLVVVLANACVVSDGLPLLLYLHYHSSNYYKTTCDLDVVETKNAFRKPYSTTSTTTTVYETTFAALQTCVPEEIRDLVLANFYRALLLYSYCYFWELRIIRL